MSSVPRYGWRASGTRTDPSGCWWFSSRATIVRPTATAVPLRVWRRPVPLGLPDPATDAAGLVVGAVRGRGELPVGALGGDPGLAVELAGGRGAEVAGGDVDHPVGQLKGL